MDADTVKTKLIKEAIAQHGNISPCGFEHTLLDCFTQDHNGEWMLWFNVGPNTHAVHQKELSCHTDQKSNQII